MKKIIPLRELPLLDETPNADTLAAFTELDNGGGHRFSGSTEALFAELIKETSNTLNLTEH